ncbi:hypothetical protein [Streptomyces sp. S186]|uniref:hypothetical protein n=1 Tax=Streptomyces sp. S186 TaxID=3434395 RepID=UPI003F67A450
MGHRIGSAIRRREAERQRERERRDEQWARRLGEALLPLPELPPPPKAATRDGSRSTVAQRYPLEPTAIRNCPHCQQPVTIVALLAPPGGGPTRHARRS